MKHYFILITTTLVSFFYANFGYIPKEDPDMILGLFLFAILSFSLLCLLFFIDVKNYINKKRNLKKRF
jgi:Mg2+ and Co2+ transporter CorA